jgi:hypothetical protein
VLGPKGLVTSHVIETLVSTFFSLTSSALEDFGNVEAWVEVSLPNLLNLEDSLIAFPLFRIFLFNLYTSSFEIPCILNYSITYFDTHLFLEGVDVFKCTSKILFLIFAMSQ